MTTTFDVPDYVKDSMARRARAIRTRTCVYDHCSHPAAIARGGRAARCLQCDQAEFTATPVPDPTRTLDALRTRMLEEAAA